MSLGKKRRVYKSDRYLLFWFQRTQNSSGDHGSLFLHVWSPIFASLSTSAAFSSIGSVAFSTFLHTAGLSLFHCPELTCPLFLGTSKEPLVQISIIRGWGHVARIRPRALSTYLYTEHYPPTVSDFGGGYCAVHLFTSSRIPEDVSLGCSDWIYNFYVRCGQT